MSFGVKRRALWFRSAKAVLFLKFPVGFYKLGIPNERSNESEPPAVAGG